MTDAVATGRSTLRARTVSAGVVGAVAFSTTFLSYFLGAGRSYDYDSSVTVGDFIATPSLLDPFRRTDVFNNHPLFSFLDHVVYTLGGRGEMAMRVLPIMFGAATVALLAWWCSRRWGALAGASAAAVMASNPMFAEVAREVRGYSLLTLCALGSSLILIRLLQPAPRRWSVGYVALLAIGIGTHLYGLLLIPTHAAVIVTRHGSSRRWVNRWILAVLLGSLPYLAIIRPMFSSASARGHAFRVAFPFDLGMSLLGVHPVAVVATSILCTIAVQACRWNRSMLAAVGVLVAAIALDWLVLRPYDLYPRFFVWLTPALGVVAGYAVSRWRSASLLAVLCVVSTVVWEAGGWVETPYPSRQVAHLLGVDAARGLRPCLLGFSDESFAAYEHPTLEFVTSTAQLPDCGIAVQSNLSPAKLVSATRVLLPHRTVLKATAPLEVYTR